MVFLGRGECLVGVEGCLQRGLLRVVGRVLGVGGIVRGERVVDLLDQSAIYR